MKPNNIVNITLGRPRAPSGLSKTSTKVGTKDYYNYTIRRLSIMTDTELSSGLSLSARLKVWKTLKAFWTPYMGRPEDHQPLKTIQFNEVKRVIAGGLLND